jgi:hypothetical protein
MGFSKLFALWLIKLLTESHKQLHCQMAEKSLEKIYRSRKKFSTRIITMDVTWIHQDDVKTKFQSKEYRLPGEDPLPESATLFICWEDNGNRFHQ